MQQRGTMERATAFNRETPLACETIETHASSIRALNAQRHGHALIDFMRLRASHTPGSVIHRALGEALSSAAASALDGSFREIRAPLERAMAALPEDHPSSASTARDLQRIAGYLGSHDLPVPHTASAGACSGTQALAGVVCARLLSNTVSAGLPASDQPASLLDSAAASAAHDLIRQLIECQSKDQIHERLASFADNFTMGTRPLPKGRLSIVDEVRSAIVECDAFDVEWVGIRLATPSGSPMLVAAYNSFDPAGFGLAA
ncbi:hypothetical protein J7J08_02520 [Stenotrophomonas sp. ISL-67]|uniref:hypothetical protein n=1 Tax=Stenotrophomonas sp. ISL-67 TaxID=2819171 RepID=UPI001BEA525E|nr:hypothetical protein [Stenotrophomonas sp. ISL-67]MBT2766510.1 hypothetical protein [Stenotrophomonas sp. ISL-67]